MAEAHKKWAKLVAMELFVVATVQLPKLPELGQAPSTLPWAAILFSSSHKCHCILFLFYFVGLYLTVAV